MMRRDGWATFDSMKIIMNFKRDQILCAHLCYPVRTFPWSWNRNKCYSHISIKISDLEIIQPKCANSILRTEIGCQRGDIEQNVVRQIHRWASHLFRRQDSKCSNITFIWYLGDYKCSLARPSSCWSNFIVSNFNVRNSMLSFTRQGNIAEID